MLGYLSADIICSEKWTVFRERSSRKTVSYEEQIMSKEKYPGIFLSQMEAIVFIILQIFFATRAIFKIGEYFRRFPSFSWGILRHVTRLDQSCAREKNWWIITYIMIWYDTIRYDTIRYDTIQYNTIRYNMLLHVYGSVSQGLGTINFTNLIGWNGYWPRSRFFHLDRHLDRQCFEVKKLQINLTVFI